MQDPYGEGLALRLHGPDEPVYTISVAARLLGVNPQTLRVLERYGLVCPFRTENNIRLYSENDLILLRRACHLIRVERINVAGVRVILRMEGTLSDEDRGEEERDPGDRGDEDRRLEGSGLERPGPGGRAAGERASPVRRIPVEVENGEDVSGGTRGEQARRAGVDEEVRLHGEGRGHRPGHD